MSRLKRPCLNHPDRLIASGSLCDECYRATKQRFGGAWAATSKRIIARDGGRCQLRLDGCTRVATTADHEIRAADGGTDDDSNLRAACRHCNSVRSGIGSGGQRRRAPAPRIDAYRSPVDRASRLDRLGPPLTPPARRASGPSVG